MVSFAIFLGFAHEEESTSFALFVGGMNLLVGMTAFAAAVAISVIAITLIAIKAFSVGKERMNRYEKYIPKVTGLVLLVLAFLFLPVFGGPSIH